MSNDITNLVLLYATEAINNTFIPEIPKSMHQKLIKYLGSNPRAAKVILKSFYPVGTHSPTHKPTHRFTMEEIAPNPDLRVINKWIKQREQMGTTNPYISVPPSLYKNLVNNKLAEPSTIESIENIIDGAFEFVNVKQNRSYTQGLMRDVHSYRSKKLFDKFVKAFPYYPPYNVVGNINRECPYYLDGTPEENEQALNDSFETMYGSGFEQAVNHPRIIGQIEMIAGLRPGRPDIFQANEHISLNPDAIHILQARPDLIHLASVVSNPRVCELIESGHVKFSDIDWTKLPNCPESFKLIKKNVDLTKFENAQALVKGQDLAYSGNKYGMRLIKGIAKCLHLQIKNLAIMKLEIMRFYERTEDTEDICAYFCHNIIFHMDSRYPGSHSKPIEFDTYQKPRRQVIKFLNTIKLIYVGEVVEWDF